MPLPKNRSTKYRRLARKTAKGTKTVFLKPRGVKAACAICKTPLFGIRSGSKTEKSVSRKFGGHLCHKCVSRVVRDVVRIREGVKSLDAVDLLYLRYVKSMLGPNAGK